MLHVALPPLSSPQHPPTHRLGPRVVFDSTLGAPLHVTRNDVTVLAREDLHVLYTVPDACVFRLAPSPLVHMVRDRMTGAVTAAPHRGLPPNVMGALGALAIRATRVQV